MKFTRELLNDKEFIMYEKFNVPRMFRKNKIDDLIILGKDKKIKSFNEANMKKLHSFFKNLEKNIEEGVNLYISGPVGVGKTMALSILLIESIKICKKWNDELVETIEDKDPNYFENDGSSYKHLSYFILGSTMTQLMFTNSLSEKELKIRRMLKNFTVLGIDDITKIIETKVGNEISFIDDILRHRKLMKLSTFMTSQIPVNKINTVFSGPIFDLIRESVIIEFAGESQRREK